MPPTPTPDDPTAARRAGVLLHVTSLPGGRLGPEALRFVDWLAEAGQSWWQILPLDAARPARLAVQEPVGLRGLAGAAGDARGRASPPATRRTSGSATRPGSRAGSRFAGAGALEDQVRFDREWGALRAYAAERGVRIMGDLPFYVAPRGADVRAHPHLFRDDVVAGVPPDAFSAAGELWGNPTYDWRAMREEGTCVVGRPPRPGPRPARRRPDRPLPRASSSFWGVPPGRPHGAHGRWLRGPGGAPVEAALRELGPLSLVAEDLGVITPSRSTACRPPAPRDARLQFAFPGGTTRTCREPRRAHRPLRRHPRQRHRRGLVGVRGRRHPGRDDRRRGPPGRGGRAAPPDADAHDARLARRPGDRDRPGRPGPRRRRPHEPPGAGGRQLGVAPAAGAAHPADHAAWLREQTEAAGRLP